MTEASIVGYLITSKRTGKKRLEFEPLDDLPFNRERFTWEPLFLGGPLSPTNTTLDDQGRAPRTGDAA